MTDPTPLAGSTANSLEAGAPSNATVGANAPAIRAAARVAALALGALYAFPHPYRFSTDDAVSYLDVADAYWHRHWSSAINGYWSPLYSWMLAVVNGLVLVRASTGEALRLPGQDRRGRITSR